MRLGIVFRPSHRRVELEPNDESHGVDKNPKLNDHEGSDGPIELVVAAKVRNINAKEVRG